MTAALLVLLVLAGVAAVVDWVALGTGRRRLEGWAKPAVLILLVAAAVAADPASDAVRAWIVIGLIGGLAGDVLLYLDRFIPGAAAFMLGHVAYIVALAMVPMRGPDALLGLVIILAVGVGPGRCIVMGAWRRARLLGAIVGLYLAVIGAMAVLALGSANPWMATGALLFVASDTLLGWGRFVGSAPGGRVAVHVTYHLAQACVVLALPTLA